MAVTRSTAAARGPLALVEPSRRGGLDARRVPELLELAAAAERSGQPADARAWYERALARLDADSAAAAPTALRGVARTHVHEGDHDAAWDVLEAAAAVATAIGDVAALGHATNIQAVVRWRQGFPDEAERLYEAARAHARRAGDARLAAMAAQNLGILADVRGDYELARRQYEAGLAEFRALGLVSEICGVLVNLGLMAMHQERWDDAHRALDEARGLADFAGEAGVRIVAEVNVAELWVRRGRLGEARDAVRHALELARWSNNEASLAQATKLQGMIARETGELGEAESHFARAEALAASREDLLQQAEIVRERADLARRLGRNRETFQHLNRSHALFERLRAQRELVGIDRRFAGLEAEFVEVARKWGSSIDAKDRYTQGHCVRVSDLACAIAVHAGFDARTMFWFRIGGLLHDVGKIVIPGEVLNKPGKLTDEEWVLMRSHTTAGVEILADIEFPWDIRPMVLHHHERWDGRGYHGLAGEAIPLEARILAVADVYDALTSVRSYKRAFTHLEAAAIIRGDAGTAFDPRVVAWFEAVAPEYFAGAA